MTKSNKKTGFRPLLAGVILVAALLCCCFMLGLCGSTARAGSALGVDAGAALEKETRAAAAEPAAGGGRVPYEQKWENQPATNVGGFSLNSKYKEWYDNAPGPVNGFEYELKFNFTCANPNCGNVAVRPFELDEVYLNSTPGETGKSFTLGFVSVQDSPNANKISFAYTGYNDDWHYFDYTHAHAESADTDYIVFFINDETFTLSVEDIVSGEKTQVFAYAKGTPLYEAFLRYIKSGMTGSIKSGMYKTTINVYERAVLDMRNVIPLPDDPVQEGYTFTGWYFDEACTRPYDGSPIYSDMTLYPGWEINRYTVSFDAAGGSAVEALTVEWSAKAENLPEPTRTGYNFLGWFLADGTKYEAQPVKADMTLTARWEAIIYTVTFMVGGEVYATVQVPYGMSLVQAMKVNGLQYYNIKSVAAADGSAVEDLTVTGEMSVEMSEKKTEEKAVSFVRAHWKWFAVGAGALLVVLVGGGIMAARKKKG